MKRVIVALAALAGITVASACDSEAQPACDCDDPTITINIPPEVADSASLHLSGPACLGVIPACSNQTNGCSQYTFDAAGDGDCYVEVDFAGGQVFRDDISVIDADDACCTGFFANPPSAATVDVPAPDGGVTSTPDAG